MCIGKSAAYGALEARHPCDSLRNCAWLPAGGLSDQSPEWSGRAHEGCGGADGAGARSQVSAWPSGCGLPHVVNPACFGVMCPDTASVSSTGCHAEYCVALVQEK